MTGTGVTKDYEKALNWYNNAAKQGSADAEFGLGYMYEQGLGVKKDYGQAFLYYSSAARQGHPTAQNNLGSMYERGEGMRKDLHKAAAWYQKAADKGSRPPNVIWLRCTFLERVRPKTIGKLQPGSKPQQNSGTRRPRKISPGCTTPGPA